MDTPIDLDRVLLPVDRLPMPRPQRLPHLHQAERVGEHRLVGQPHQPGLIPPPVAGPLLDGADLGAIARQSGPVPPEQVVTWISSTATALSALHDAGHRHGQLRERRRDLQRERCASQSVRSRGLCRHASSRRDLREWGVPL